MNATLTTIQPEYHTAHFIGEWVPRTQDTDKFESIQRREARVTKTEEGLLFSGAGMCRSHAVSVWSATSPRTRKATASAVPAQDGPCTVLGQNGRRLYNCCQKQEALPGAGIAQWLEHRTRDWKVAGSNPCWNGGRIFFSRVDFLCWLLFRYPFHPRVTAVARKKSRSFCQKVQVAGYS